MRRSSLSLKNCFQLSKQTRPPISIEQVNCHYSYKVGIEQVQRAIHYMTKPTDRKMIDNDNFDLNKLLCIDLKNLRYVRFWGKASNSRYKKGEDSKNKRNPFPEINGEAYKFVGIVSQGEFEAETEGKALSCTPEGFIIALDEFPDASSG